MLRSQPVDQAVFSIPLDRLSSIIEDEDGFHVIKVLERDEARVLSFAEADPEIRKTLNDEKRREMEQKLIADLRKKTSVWTLWPEDWEGARPLSDYIGVQVPAAAGTE